MMFIKELKEYDQLQNEIYLCKSKQTLIGKTGKSYISMIMQDKTGTIDAKIWDNHNGIQDFEAMDFVHIDARVTSYQDSLQLNISRIYKSMEGEYDPKDYVPVSSRDIEQMFVEIMSYVNSVKEDNLKKILKMLFINDIEFIKEFKNHSAAKTIHHGFMGGLLEHTLSVVNLCQHYASNYKIINRDLLITAALLHDIGKMDEISSFPENDYTIDGQLLGHIFIGSNKVLGYIKKIDRFPEKLSNELIHCILAHHGKLEYGSPKKPATIEAMALHFADNTDAKLQSMTELLSSSDSKVEWMGYQRMFESNIMRSTKGE